MTRPSLILSYTSLQRKRWLLLLTLFTISASPLYAKAYSPDSQDENPQAKKMVRCTACDREIKAEEALTRVLDKIELFGYEFSLPFPPQIAYFCNLDCEDEFVLFLFLLY